jgi:hypothetical protein
VVEDGLLMDEPESFDALMKRALISSSARTNRTEFQVRDVG